MLARIFSFNSGLAPFRAIAHCELSTFFKQRLDLLVAQAVDVVEHEHQAADLFHQLGILAGEILQEAALRGPIDDVEHAGHAGHAAGVLELLADDARHAMFQPALDFLDDLGAGLAHRGHAADDRQLPLGRQAL